MLLLQKNNDFNVLDVIQFQAQTLDREAASVWGLFNTGKPQRGAASRAALSQHKHNFFFERFCQQSLFFFHTL